MPSNLFGSKRPEKAHLLRGSGGLAAEIADLRDDVEEAFLELEQGGGSFHVDEFTNPAAADPDALVETAQNGSAAAIVTLDSAVELDGVVGLGTMSPPRNVTVTTSAVTGAYNTTDPIVVTGLDVDGNALTDELALTAANGDEVVAGDACFAQVTSIAIPIQTLATSEFLFGFGAALGLSKKAAVRAGAVNAIAEIHPAGNAGAFGLPAAAAPNGSYTPDSGIAPNGVRDYAVTYEVAAPA